MIEISAIRPRDTISGLLLCRHVGFQFDSVDFYPLLAAVTSLKIATPNPPIGEFNVIINTPVQ